MQSDTNNTTVASHGPAGGVPPTYSSAHRFSVSQCAWAVLQLARRDLKVRYKNSALGFFWSFLNPLMQIVILTIVFKNIMDQKTSNYSMELFTCFLPWMFFAQSLNDGAVCVARDALLVKKYPFPRVCLPISSLLSNFVHLLLGFAVLFAAFAFLRVDINVHFLWVIPLLAIQSCLTLGVVLLCATLQMYYEDIRFLLNSVTQVLFFLCPVAYGIDRVLGSDQVSPFWQKAYLLANPLTPLFVGYRTALLHAPEWPVPHYFCYLGASALWAALVLGVGLLVWRRYEWHFPEVA